MKTGLKTLCAAIATIVAVTPSVAQIQGGVQKAAPADAAPTTSSLAPFWVGQVKVLKGRASVVRENLRQELIVGAYLKQGDVVHTESTGSVGITFNDNTTLSAGPNSHIAINRFSFDTTTHQGQFEANVVRGTVAVQPGYIARNSPEAMRVNTPASELRGHAAAYVVGVRGE